MTSDPVSVGAAPRFRLVCDPRLPPMPLLVTALFFLVMLTIMAALGLTHSWLSPDTASFADGCGDGGCWGGPRTPFYGWAMAAFSRTALVGLQFAAMLAAAYTLCAGVTAAGGSAAAATAAGLAVACSTVTLLWTRALLPEAFAHAALLAGFGCVLSRRAGLAGLLVAAACLLKPALLPFAIVVPLAQLVVHGRRHLVPITLGCWSPLLAVALLRFCLVGDVNIVSFGGFQMSGIAALMLTPELAHRLPATLQATANGIIERRGVLVSAGAALPIPLDSQGIRSFLAASLGYDDVLARTYDPVLYGAVRPGRLAGESWVSFNARLQHLALATIAADPVAYVGWVLGGLARVAGRIALFNPLFLLSIAGCAVSRRWSVGTQRDRLVLWTLGGAWLLGTVPPIVMLSFPAARYIDSAGLMLPLIPLCCLVTGLLQRSRVRDRRASTT